MNSLYYQVIRTQFTLFLTPKTFIATVTFLTLLAHPTVQLPASSSSNHHIIFNPIGTIAAKMSYIHVAIPINISSIQHQLDSFTSYVQRFSNLNTTHNNKMHFARVINQLATFALNELNHGRDQLRNLDTLLPDDSTPNTRHKRFVDGVLFEVCKKDYHFQKINLNNCWDHLKIIENQLTLCRSHTQHLQDSDIPSFSYMHDTSLPRQAKFFWIDLLNQCKTDQVRASLNQATCDRNTQKANKAIDTCIGLLKSRNFNQSIFDDIIYNRMPFTNETFTTTTTPPPTTTYPHYPFPANNAMYPGTIHVRHTRQILVAAAAVGGILGTFLGLFNDHKITEIKHDLVHLEDQHNGSLPMIAR